MRELPRQFWTWIVRLLPKQQNSGSGAVQVGRADGDVKVLQLTQHIYARSFPAPLAVTPQTCAPPQPSHPSPPPPQRPVATPEQRDVLFLMQKLPDRIAVLDFMEREFNTRMVIELQPVQVYRLRRYVEVVLNEEQPLANYRQANSNRRERIRQSSDTAAHSLKRRASAGSVAQDGGHTVQQIFHAPIQGDVIGRDKIVPSSSSTTRGTTRNEKR